MKTTGLLTAAVATVLLFMLVHFSFAHISPGYEHLVDRVVDRMLPHGLAGLQPDDSMDEWNPVQSEVAEDFTCANLSAETTVYGCFLKGSNQLAIVRFEVSWTSAMVNPTPGNMDDLITITLGDSIKTINPGPFNGGVIVSPYAIAFEVPADGSTLTAQLFTGMSFEGSSCALEITDIAIPTNAGCGSGGGASGNQAACAFGQLGGFVWRDSNTDGIRQRVNEPRGVKGVLVDAYDSTGNHIDSAVTDASGRYLLSNVDTTDYPLRVQFRQVPTGTIFPYQSDVRFVYHPSCNVNFAIYAPSTGGGGDEGEGIPFATTCFVEGDPASESTPNDVLVASTTTFTDPVVLATKSAVGSVWGVAYHPEKQVLLSAAFLKRHAGLGPLGLGGIYMTDLTNPDEPTTSSFIDLDDYTDLGTIGELATTGSRKFKDENGNGINDPSEPSWDQEAFAKIAKVGLGDIDLSSDNNTLYAVNLFTKEMITVDLTGYNTTGTLPSGMDVSTLPGYLPVACGDATDRPFGLKVYEGKLYLGLVCDGSPAYLQVQAYDFETAAWEVALPLSNISYDRPAQASYPFGPNAIFREWTDVFSPVSYLSGGDVYQGNLYNIHQAILSDIEFDAEGNMILGISWPPTITRRIRPKQ